MAIWLPLPTKAELKESAPLPNTRRKATAENLLQDRVMTREELIKDGLLSDREVN